MKTFLIVIGALSGVILTCLSSPLVLYGTEYGNFINVTTSSGTVVKTFHTRASGIKSLAIHSKQDLLFVADNRKIIRIHLLDGKGKRKISGTGELFRNARANHFESQILSFSSYGISAAESSLLVDETANKLYIGGRCAIYELNLNGSDVRAVFILRRGKCDYRELTHPSLYNGMFFFMIGSSALYRAILDRKSLVNITNQNIVLYESGIRDIVVEKKSGKLFYVNSDDHQIRVMTQEELLRMPTTTAQPSTEPTATRTQPSTNYSYPRYTGSYQTRETDVPIPYLDKKYKTVLSNYRFTDKVEALAVTGRYMFWCSRDESKIYSGKLNEDMNFLATDNIHTIKREVRTKQIVLYSFSGKIAPPHFLVLILLILIK